MPVETYDLIVVGDELAGLISATLCARRGLRVLLIEGGERPSSYELGPYQLPVDPLPFIGHGSPAVSRVLDELQFHHEIRRRLSDRAPAFQYVGPDTRLDLTADNVALAREVARELGSSDEAVAAGTSASEIASRFETIFGQDIAVPPTGFWEKREIGRLTGHLEEDANAWFQAVSGLPEGIRPLFQLPALLGSHGGESTLTPATMSRCFSLWRHGTPRLDRDLAGLRSLLLEKYAAHNGELRDGNPVELTFNWGRVSGVKLDDGLEFGAQHVIAAMPVDELALLSEKKLTKRLRACVDSMEVAGYRYVLNIVVRETGVPAGMGSTVLLVADPNKPLVGDNAFAVFAGEPDDESRRLITLEAICPVPKSDRHLDDAFADLRVRLRERLEMVMPFFSEHVLLVHSPNESAPAEGLSGEYTLPKPVTPRPVWRSSSEPTLGVSALPYSVGHKNLSMATMQIMPGLGLEGEFLAGWSAAKLACQSTGKKKDYLKDEVIRSSTQS